MGPDDARIGAALDLLARTGAGTVTVRQVDPDPEAPGWPVVWLVRATWERPDVPTGERIAAGPTPVDALEAMLEVVVDGGECQRCGRPAGLIVGGYASPLPDPAAICWYRLQGERYATGCEA